MNIEISYALAPCGADNVAAAFRLRDSGGIMGCLLSLIYAG